MAWTHRIIEHRLSPERRLGLENRVAGRGAREHAPGGGGNRREGDRRVRGDRRVARRR
jgi:hypothetical protein